MNYRYSPTNNIGRGIFQYEISKMGWIPREFLSTDMGIDYTIEEVVDHVPTGRYISVQLKTGIGNVSTNRNGDYVYYIDDHHYEYWLRSSIPVILVLCLPDRNELVWSLIKRVNIKQTKSKHKIFIPNNHLLNSDSNSELSEIIRLYQSPIQINADIEDMKDPDYIEGLFEECAATIRELNHDFLSLGDKYTREVGNLEEFYNHPSIWTKEKAEKICRKFANNMSLSINIYRCKLQQKAEVIFTTYIGAIRSIDYVLTIPDWYSLEAAALVKVCLESFVKTLENHQNFMEEGTNKLMGGRTENAKLDRSIHDFATALKDYIALIRDMSLWTSLTIEKINNNYEIPSQLLEDMVALYNSVVRNNRPHEKHT